MNGTVRYWAAAREAAGVAEEPYEASTLAEAIEAAVSRHGGPAGALAKVLARCAYVVDGAPASRRAPAEVELSEGGCVEVLPPFAGGAANLGAGSATMRRCRPFSPPAAPAC